MIAGQRDASIAASGSAISSATDRPVTDIATEGPGPSVPDRNEAAPDPADRAQIVARNIARARYRVAVEAVQSKLVAWRGLIIEQYAQLDPGIVRVDVATVGMAFASVEAEAARLRLRRSRNIAPACAFHEHSHAVPNPGGPS